MNGVDMRKFDRMGRGLVANKSLEVSSRSALTTRSTINFCSLVCTNTNTNINSCIRPALRCSVSLVQCY